MGLSRQYTNGQSVSGFPRNGPKQMSKLKHLLDSPPSKTGFFHRLEQAFQQQRHKLEDSSTKLTSEQKQKAQEFFGSEGNLLKRQRLIKEAMSEGYYHNAKMVLKHGVKLWEAPTKLSNPLQSPRMPHFENKFHSTGITLNEVINSNKCSLITFQFNLLGERHVNSFINPFLKEFSSSDGFGVSQVNVVEQPTKSPVVKMLQPYLRWKFGDSHKRVLNVYENIYDKKQLLRITNSVLGWVYLVDTNGYCRWYAHGIATDKELDSLRRLAHKLSDESHLK